LSPEREEKRREEKRREEKRREEKTWGRVVEGGTFKKGRDNNFPVL
jgi:hypothetical protein